MEGSVFSAIPKRKRYVQSARRILTSSSADTGLFQTGQRSGLRCQGIERQQDHLRDKPAAEGKSFT